MDQHNLQDKDPSFQDNENPIKSWQDLVQNLSINHLENLEIIFKRSDGGLTKEEFFFNSMEEGFNLDECSQDILTLFDLINKNNLMRITWANFLEFMTQNIVATNANPLSFQMSTIVTVPQTKRETIVKIVLIETQKYFCYAMVSKHGRVGLYDGNLNFLTTYQLIMTREDIYRKEEDRRRRNRWVTDAVFCVDVLMFIVTNTARSIIVYEASSLKHVPLWLILSTPNVVECFAYKSSDGDEKGESTLYMGDDRGKIFSFVFLQPKTLLLRKKHNDKINLFYWDELPQEKDYLIIKRLGKPHHDGIKRIVYIKDGETLVSCSKDIDASLIIKYVRLKNPPYIYKIPKGCNCFALSRLCNILITGSEDGVLRLWNPLITSKPIGTLKEHKAAISDVKIIEKQNFFISCSRDGTLKLWDIKEQNCVQSFTINFPSFSVFGKLIEWGIECIYPGPKRNSEEDVSVWERSPILVACCNHIAIIKILRQETENGTEKQVLPPPPLQNSVLVPKMWKTSDKVESISEEEKHEEIDVAKLEERLKELDFILKKDLFELSGRTNSDINFKIATLERKKLQMQQHVARGAPYLALDLHEVDNLYLKPGLPVPNRRKIKNVVENIEKVLRDASCRDLIFSEPSSSRSPRSSRSSFIEFD